MQRSGSYLGAVAVLTAGILVAACSTSTDSGGGATDNTSSTTSASSEATTTSVAGSGTGSETSAPANAPVVTEVPEEPGAAPAVQAFVNDLVAGADVTATCWTVAPSRARQMYADVDAITSAVTGTVAPPQNSITWSDGTTDVTVAQTEIASGYACPYVYPTGDANGRYTAADATYVVQRYLGRLAGQPINSEDVESTYPLVCTSAHQSPTPLQDNPNPFGSVGLVDATGASAQPAAGDDIRVTIPAEIDGLWRDVNAWVRIGYGGYCIEELGPAA